jgi:hypothetical protein
MTLYMKIYLHFLSYLAPLFVWYEMLYTKVVEKMKKKFQFLIIFFEYHAVYEIVWEKKL